MDKKSEAKIVYNALEELSKCRSEPTMYGDTPIMLDDIPGMKEILDLHENQKACVKKYRALGYNSDQILVELQKL